MSTTGVFPAVTGAPLVLSVSCPTGGQILNAAFDVQETLLVPVRLREFQPLTAAPGGWRMTIVEDVPTGRTVLLEALCLVPA